LIAKPLGAKRADWPSILPPLHFDLLVNFQPLVITEISYSGAKVNFFETMYYFLVHFEICQKKIADKTFQVFETWKV
jgi:hypothetical protein